MGFVSSILVVEEIARSRQLYEKILGMKVAADFGIYNVGFEGGLSLYRKAFFEELTGLPVDSGKHNTLAVYFEVEDLEALEKEIGQNGFEFIHKIREQPWKQRTFRFYDHDDHLIEAAEKMEAVIRRLVQEGNSVEQIAKWTGYPEEQVVGMIKVAESR